MFTCICYRSLAFGSHTTVGSLPYIIKHLEAIVVVTWSYINKTELNLITVHVNKMNGSEEKIKFKATV